MIEADQPYCADVDECSDERDQFNKLHVGSSDNQRIPHLLSWVIVVAETFAGVRRLHQLHQLGRLLQL